MGKWEDANEFLSDLLVQYKQQKVVYIDINRDIKDKKYRWWKEEKERLGWTFYESATWTRKGQGNHKNTNTDIVLTHGIENDVVRVKW